jgi:glycosyltransferase involved in cell wall biosynthesis
MRAVAARGVDVAALLPRVFFNGSQVQPAEYPHYRELAIHLPGWTRFGRLSTTLVARRIRELTSSYAVIYTLPQYARVAEKIRGPLSVYFAHDPFQFYDSWDKKIIAEYEQRMLDRSDIVFAITDALAEDFRKTTRTPITTLRNATSRSFIEQLRSVTPSPSDLGEIRRPIIGCVGQLSESTYDWDLIAGVAAAIPEASLVFVGPIFARTPKIENVLGLPNVWWLGPRPHEELPAYLNGFDVCLNPLKQGAHSDRRSPLRLYDYLATDKPILSTAIQEAYLHRSFIEIGHTTDECVALLRRLAWGGPDRNLPARHRYIENNTWDNRAAELLQRILDVRQ